MENTLTDADTVTVTVALVALTPLVDAAIVALTDAVLVTFGVPVAVGVVEGVSVTDTVDVAVKLAVVAMITLADAVLLALTVEVAVSVEVTVAVPVVALTVAKKGSVIDAVIELEADTGSDAVVGPITRPGLATSFGGMFSLPSARRLGWASFLARTTESSSSPSPSDLSI